jgi:phosphate transport system permease protein
MAFTPEHTGDPFTVLPLQIFSWVTRGEEFRGLAAAAVLVLLALLLVLNVLAVVIGRRSETRSPGSGS